MMRSKIVSALMAVLISVLSLAGCVSVVQNGPSDKNSAAPTGSVDVAPRVGYMAPGFELNDLDGEVVSLESLRGKYVMLNFWATWCGPCRMEMPYIQEIYESPAWTVRGLVIAAVNKGEPAERVAGFIDDFGFDFMVLLDSSELVSRAYNVSGIPVTFFIDTEGIIKHVRLGMFRNRAEIEEYLRDLIEA